MPRECQESAEVAVNHQPKVCKGSADARVSSVSRTHTSALVPPGRIELPTPALGGRASTSPVVATRQLCSRRLLLWSPLSAVVAAVGFPRRFPRSADRAVNLGPAATEGELSSGSRSPIGTASVNHTDVTSDLREPHTGWCAWA